MGIVKKLAGLTHSSSGMSRHSVCLVLGGTGLLGRALRSTIEELEQQAGDLDGYHFVFVGSHDADLRDWHQTQMLFHKHQPSAIIHLAAKVGGLYENMRKNEEFLRENVLINTNVVQAATEAKVPRAIFCLSTCAYPEKVPDLPLVEEYLHLAPSHPSNEGYAAAKRLLEQQVRFGRERLRAQNPGESFVWICVIPCNLYGPHDNFELNTAHVLPALVHKTEIAKRSGDTLLVRGRGLAYRQFLFSDDAARLLLLLLVKREIPDSHCLLNLCPDLDESEVTIGNLASMITRCSEFDGEIAMDGYRNLSVDLFQLLGYRWFSQFDEAAPEGVSRKPADNKKLRELVGNEFLFTPLEEGVQKTVDWFRDNMNHARK